MIRTRTAAALAAALGGAPALAQTMGTGSPAIHNNAPANSAVGPGAASGPGSTTNRSNPAAPGGGLGANTANRNDAASNRNPVLTDNTDMRASKVIGSSVYNDHDQKIGSIDDILMNKDHQATAAVVSVGGFLGLGSKLVQVPYDKLQFGNTQSNSDNRVVLPGATKDSVSNMPAYHYSRNG